MTFTYQLEAADWIAFNVHCLKNSRVHRRQRFWTCLGVPSAILVLGLIGSLVIQKDSGFAIASCVICVVVFFAYPKVYDDSILKRLKRIMDDPENTKAFGRQTVTLSPDGYHSSRPGAEATIAWDHVVRLAETSDHVFLYLSAIDAIVIPRRSVEGASFEDVKARLCEYVGKTASGD